MEPYLFVYGTLRSDFHNQSARFLRTHATLIGPAQATGRIYRLSHYPAYRRSANGQVTGELWRLHNPSLLMPVLDRYEGHCYRRKLVTIQTSRQRVKAWIYEWRWALPDWRSIPSGDYLHATRTGRSE